MTHVYVKMFFICFKKDTVPEALSSLIYSYLFYRFQAVASKRIGPSRRVRKRHSQHAAMHPSMQERCTDRFATRHEGRESARRCARQEKARWPVRPSRERRLKKQQSSPLLQRPLEGERATLVHASAPAFPPPRIYDTEESRFWQMTGISWRVSRNRGRRNWRDEPCYSSVHEVVTSIHTRTHAHIHTHTNVSYTRVTRACTCTSVEAYRLVSATKGCKHAKRSRDAVSHANT